MNGLQDRKAQDIESSFPGCLGRMVNLFDLGTAVSGNKLLTDKPHLDGSSLSRSRSDVTRVLSPSFGDHIEDKVIMSKLKRSASNKVNGTPMKKLIAQEMSKEVDPKQSPTNVVAKLMGLDTLPQHHFDTAAQRSKSKGYSRFSSRHEARKCQECNEYKDVYEILEQSQKTSPSRDSSPRKGRYDENMNEKTIALVRQKFKEAKRLVTDEKLHQSKEFQDALEVLSSNKALFVKFLQESNSFYSQHLCNFESIPPVPETKRITVLRPSKMVDTENFVVQEKMSHKQVNKSASWDNSNPGYPSSFVNSRVEERPSLPTRIVVLKPSPGKIPDIKAVASSSPSLPRVLHGGGLFEEPEDVEERESRELAKEITQRMRENLMGHRRDETLFSSVFSNGYMGGDSSFNKSHDEYPVENLIDSEIMSPTSRNSWDCIDRFGTPYSSLSLSRASFSPDSPVCREAKKRLSERWVLMASNGSFQQQKHVPKSSSTLGEMLALSAVKTSARPEEESNTRKLEPRESTSCLSSGLNQEESASNSPQSLQRSTSVPVSSTACGTKLNFEIPAPEANKAQFLNELTESKNMKSSWKVPSLFLFRNRKAGKEKSCASQSSSESQLATPETTSSPVVLPAKASDNPFPCAKGVALEECSSLGTIQRQSIFPREEELSMAKPLMPGNSSENQDQPSPISVLQPPFEEDDSMVADSSGLIKPGHRGAGMSLKPNLIDKSPIIGLIARTLSWNDSFTDTATRYSAKPSSTRIGEEQDWYLFIHNLLSAAGFDGNMQSDPVFARWHSPESPLDPSFRDKYANLNDKELIHEAKRRQHRSQWKLVFDFVNEALVEITRTGLYKSSKCLPYTRSSNGVIDGDQLLLSTLADYLWTQLKDWLSGEMNCVSCDSEDTNSLVAERAVRDEIVGRVWGENMRMEVDNLRKEIEGKLMEELVYEAVIDFTK